MARPIKRTSLADFQRDVESLNRTRAAILVEDRICDSDRKVIVERIDALIACLVYILPKREGEKPIPHKPKRGT